MREFVLKNINRGYTTLNVWQESVDLSINVRNKLKQVRISFKLKGQIEDSAVSIPSNIAEGYSRRHINEYIQHINYALGSLSENLTQIYILKETGDIDEQWFSDYDKKHYSIENKLIALNKKLIKLKETDEWNDSYKL